MGENSMTTRRPAGKVRVGQKRQSGDSLDMLYSIGNGLYLLFYNMKYIKVTISRRSQPLKPEAGFGCPIVFVCRSVPLCRPAIRYSFGVVDQAPRSGTTRDHPKRQSNPHKKIL